VAVVVPAPEPDVTEPFGIDMCQREHHGPDSGNTATSTSLLDRIKVQDEEAWGQLVRLYSPLIYSWCRRFDLDPDDAADALQNVFQAVHARVGGFRRGGEGAFRKWLWTITRSKIMDCHRAHGRQLEEKGRGGTDAQQRLLDVPEAEPAFEHLPSNDPDSNSILLQGLEPVRAELTERTWQAFWRAVVHGEPTAQIASDLDMTPNAVRKAKCRVLHRLRQRLADLIE
jgi:RNA polymerase sigma-70 factor (ECF subfamily)